MIPEREKRFCWTKQNKNTFKFQTYILSTSRRLFFTGTAAGVLGQDVEEVGWNSRNLGCSVLIFFSNKKNNVASNFCFLLLSKRVSNNIHLETQKNYLLQQLPTSARGNNFKVNINFSYSWERWLREASFHSRTKVGSFCGLWFL